VIGPKTIIKVKFSLTSTEGKGTVFGSQYRNGSYLYDKYSVSFTSGYLTVSYTPSRYNSNILVFFEQRKSLFYEPHEITFGNGQLFIDDTLMTTFTETPSADSYTPVLGIFGTIEGGRNATTPSK
jgi:hypothetical protein